MRDEPKRADDDGLAELLEGIPREADPPARLKRELLGRLRAEGLVAPGGARPPVPWLRWTLAAAALGVAFFGGRASAGLGSGGDALRPSSSGALADPAADPAGEPDPDGAARWVLLLYEDERLQAEGRTPDELVDLYTAWAERGMEEGTVEQATPLAETEALLQGGLVERRVAGAEPPPGVLVGFAVVRAGSAPEALDLARGTPHHRLGGAVLVRGIDPVP